MQEDLIANNFADHINRNLIKRNVRLVKIVFMLTSIYAIVAIADWYLYITNEKVPSHLFYFFYLRTIRPVVSLLILSLSVIGGSIAFKASKMMLSAIENKEAVTFNQGYSLGNRANIISIVSFSIGILSISFRFVMIYIFSSKGF